MIQQISYDLLPYMLRKMAKKPYLKSKQMKKRKDQIDKIKQILLNQIAEVLQNSKVDPQILTKLFQQKLIDLIIELKKIKQLQHFITNELRIKDFQDLPIETQKQFRIQLTDILNETEEQDKKLYQIQKLKQKMNIKLLQRNTYMRQSLSSDNFSLDQKQKIEVEEKKETQKLGIYANKPEKNLEMQGINLNLKQKQKKLPPGSKVISQQLKNQTPRSDIKQMAKIQVLPSKSFGNISQRQGLKINSVNRSKSKNNVSNYPITPNVIVQPKENEQETISHPKSLKKNQQKPKSQSIIRSITKKAEQKSLDLAQKGTLAKNVLEEYAEQVNQTQQKAKAQSDLQRQFKRQQDKTQKFIQSSRILKSFNSKNKQ